MQRAGLRGEGFRIRARQRHQQQARTRAFAEFVHQQLLRRRFRARHGWLWLIPLHDGTTSVGAVCSPDHLKQRRGETEAFLMRTLEGVPEVAERMSQSKPAAPVLAADASCPRHEHELAEHERAVLRAIRELRFGTVEVTVHQAQIVQITRSEKLRF